MIWGGLADGYAVCREHVNEALEHYGDSGAALRIRAVGDDDTFRCSCQEQAVWYFSVTTESLGLVGQDADE